MLKKKKFVILLKVCALIYASNLLSACGGGSESASVPIVLDAPIAYVKRPVQFDNNGDLVPIDITNPIEFHPGGDLYIRDRAASSSEERNVTSRFTGGMGDVKDVTFNDDGTKIVFAMRGPDIPNADPEDQPKWDIWEYEIATDTLSRVMPESVAQEHQDVSPSYLPTGQIIFTSTRQQGNKGILGNEGKSEFPGLTENFQQQALVLHRMNANGSSIIQLSYNQSHDLDPIVLSNGRILFSRWDNAGSNNAINLYSVNPDGTDLHLVYGAHSHDTGTNNSVIQFLQTAELSNGRIVSLLAPLNSQSGGGLLATIDINDYIDNTSPTFVNGGLTGPAQSNLVNNTILTDGSPSPGGLYSSAYPLNDGTNRFFVSWTPCRLENPSDGTIVACVDNLNNPNLVEAPPLFGLYIYDASDNTQAFVIKPQEGIMYTDIAAATPKSIPNYIPDRTTSTIPALDQALIDDEVGILNIRSVYDVDGIDAAPVGIDVVSDPGLTTADQRPARFLRIIKAVSIPDDEAIDGNRNTSLNNDAFGVSRAQGMREIIGYAPIEPDGSVKVKVPANVPLAISILDKTGKRISARHQNWIQVPKGDTLNCVGCHDHASGSPHGRPDGPPSIYTGGTSNGGYFPNTDPAGFWHDLGETMAEARTRLDPAALDLSVDIKFDDIWTDPAVRAPDASFSYLYSDLTTPSIPVSYPECQNQWSTKFPIVCRTVINYETHIHPLWSAARGGNECISCHNAANIANTQLDLTDGLNPATSREKAYEELLDEDILLDNTGQPVLIQDPDEPFLLDNNGNQVLDINGNPIPNLINVTIGPVFSTNGALASGTAFSMFEPGSGNAIHEGLLTPAELKLLAEWLDIGAQYYNDPFDVDPLRFIN
ncbi:MAG: hypothetical protein P8Y24_09155 [Gammaproteobacteria bacterium]